MAVASPVVLEFLDLLFEALDLALDDFLRGLEPKLVWVFEN